MLTESIYNILVGLLLFAVGVHIRGAYRLAQKQKLSAARLDAQLTYWKSVMIGDPDEQEIFYGDKKIQALQQALLSARGKSTWQEVLKIKGEVCQEMEENYIERYESSLIIEAAMLQKQVKIFPEGVSLLHRQAEVSIQNILNGNLFVGDNDAGTLGYLYVHTCARLKMNMVAFLKENMLSDSLMALGYQRFRSEIKSAHLSKLWRMTLILADMNTLFDKVRLLENRSMCHMACRNFWLIPVDGVCWLRRYWHLN